jgi:hypothetical protein
LHRAEQQAHERVPRRRCPVGEGRAPARFEHAEGFGDGPLWVGEVGEAQATDDGIELALLEGQVLGVPLVKFGVRTSRTGERQHIRRKVHSGDHRPPLRRGGAEPTGAAGDIQQSGAAPCLHRIQHGLIDLRSDLCGGFIIAFRCAQTA